MKLVCPLFARGSAKMYMFWCSRLVFVMFCFFTFISNVFLTLYKCTVETKGRKAREFEEEGHA